MEKENLKKLQKVIENNYKWPLIVEGASADNFPTAVVLPATILAEELGVVGDKYPLWTMELRIAAKGKTRPVLLIDAIDSINETEQEKFLIILKHRKINGFEFPKDTQIILPVADSQKVSVEVKRYCNIYKVD